MSIWLSHLIDGGFVARLMVVAPAFISGFIFGAWVGRRF